MDTLDIAGEGETLDGSDLQASINALEAMAKDLDANIATAADVDTMQAIGAAQVALRDREEALVDAQIELATGEVKITAEHVNAAATYAKEAVRQIADVKKKLETLAKVVEFFSVVASGNGAAIFNAAVKLKAAL